MLHGLRHVLTPGNPVYTALKASTVAAVFGVQYVARRRAGRAGDPPEREVPPPQARAQRPHPRSAKRKRRRRG